MPKENSKGNIFITAVCSRVDEALLVTTGNDRRVVYCNLPLLSLLEIPNEKLNDSEFAGHSFYNIFSITAGEINTALEKQGSLTVKKPLSVSNSSSHYVAITITRVQYNGVAYDVHVVAPTGAQYDKLIKAKEAFAACMEYSSIAILIINSQSEIITANPFSLNLFGYSGAELEGKKIEVLIPSRYHKEHVHHRNKFMHAPQNRPMGIAMDLFAIRKDGTEFPVEVSLGSYLFQGEQYVIAFINDITIRKNIEDKVKRLNDYLEDKVEERTHQLKMALNELEISKEVLAKALSKEKELGELKSRFVTTASHEFRTPLSTILSSAYLLQKYTAAEEQQKRDRHIERIISSVNMLTDILNDFLSVGKIEEGKISLRPVTFSVKEFIQNVIHEISSLLKKEQYINYEHEGAEIITLDASLLKHILLNLLSNAIKFSPENSNISVNSSVIENNLILRIRDKGMGISNEDQQHLFERFFRGSNASSVQGTGLGLHIVSKYAELLNGNIVCNSQLEKGTEFILSFQWQQGD